jgi:hypothetical protein
LGGYGRGRLLESGELQASSRIVYGDKELAEEVLANDAAKLPAEYAAEVDEEITDSDRVIFYRCVSGRERIELTL